MGSTGFWMRGAQAASASSPTQRLPEASARSGPAARACSTSIWATSIDLLRSVVATSPRSQSSSHTRPSVSTTTELGARLRCVMPRVWAAANCAHASSRSASVRAPPSSVSGAVGSSASMTTMIESPAAVMPTCSWVRTPARDACNEVSAARSTLAFAEGDTHREMPRRRKLFHSSTSVPVSSRPGSTTTSSRPRPPASHTW